MSEASINAYHKQLKTTETAQETEAAVLEKAAFALETAQRTPEDLEVFEKALQFNQLVWTSIQSVLDNDNQLPVEIRVVRKSELRRFFRQDCCHEAAGVNDVRRDVIFQF